MSQAPSGSAKGTEHRLEDLTKQLSDEADSARDAMAELVAALKEISQTTLPLASDYLATVEDDASRPPTSFDKSAFIRSDAADSVSETASVHREDFLAFAAARGQDPKLTSANRDPTFTAMPSVVTWATPLSARSAENTDGPVRYSAEESVEGTPEVRAKTNAAQAHVSNDRSDAVTRPPQEERVESKREEDRMENEQDRPPSNPVNENKQEDRRVVGVVDEPAEAHPQPKQVDPPRISGLPSVVTWTISGLKAPPGHVEKHAGEPKAVGDTKDMIEPADQARRDGKDGQQQQSQTPQPAVQPNSLTPSLQAGRKVPAKELQFRAMPSVVTWHPSSSTSAPVPAKDGPNRLGNSRQRPLSAVQQQASSHPQVGSERQEDRQKQPSQSPSPAANPPSTPTPAYKPSVVTWTLPPSGRKQPGTVREGDPSKIETPANLNDSLSVEDRKTSQEPLEVQSRKPSPEGSKFKALPSVVTWHPPPPTRVGPRNIQTPAKVQDRNSSQEPRQDPQSRKPSPEALKIKAMPSVVTWHPPSPARAGQPQPQPQRVAQNHADPAARSDPEPGATQPSSPAALRFRAMPSVVTWHPASATAPPSELRKGASTQGEPVEQRAGNTSSSPSPKPVQAMPSVVTWTIHSWSAQPTRPASEQRKQSSATHHPDAADARSPEYRAMPSVVTWTLPDQNGKQSPLDEKTSTPVSAEPPRRPVSGTYAAMPSVVTWMAPPSTSASNPPQSKTDPKMPDAEFLAMPSVVTWASSARRGEAEDDVDHAVAGEDGGSEVRVLLIGGRNEFEEVSDIDELSGTPGAPSDAHVWTASRRALKGPRNFAAALPPVGPDGFGMVAGGFGGGLHQATCELISCRTASGDAGPETIDWKAPGSRMLFRRSGLGLAALSDAAYAVGGFDGKTSLKMIEVLRAGPSGWSDAEGKWREVHMMAQPRYRPSAIGVEGQVLVFGGFDGDKILSSCAAFTPDGDAASTGGHGKWRDLPDMPHARMGAAALLFHDHVIIVGGLGPGRRVYAEVDVFDAKKEEWVSTMAIPPIPQPCSDSAVFVLDGNLWVVGGSDSKSWLDSVQVFEWEKQAWVAGQPLCGPVSGACILAMEA